MPKKFEQWEALDAVSRLEQAGKLPAFAEIITQRDSIENELRDTQSSFQEKVLARATQLAQATSIQKQREVIIHRVNLVRWLVTFIMIFLGSFAVMNMFNNSVSQINVFWLMIVLLGINTISIVLYIIATLQRKIAIQSLPTLLFKTVLNLFSKKSYSLSNKKNAINLIHSWNSMNLTGAVGHWSLSRYLHGAWLAYLLGALLTLILVLLAKQIDFVWGTTLLNDNFFIQLTKQMSQLQSRLGLPTLNADQILFSRIDLTTEKTAHPGLVQSRQAWAYFVISSLLLYGIFPRLLLWCYSTIRQVHAKKRYQPEWRTPYFIQLRERLIPSRSAIAIIDADKLGLSPLGNKPDKDISNKETFMSSNIVDTPINNQCIHLSDLQSRLPDDIAAFAYEWFPNYVWPVTEFTKNWGRVSSQKEQKALIKKLANMDNDQQLAICLSSDQVADRGALRFFTDLKNHVDLHLIVFNFITHKQLKRRWTEWLHVADQLNIPDDNVLLVDALSHKHEVITDVESPE